MSEEFTFQHPFCKCAAVDCQKTAILSTAEIMDGLGNEFFSRAGFSRYKHIDRQLGYFTHRVKHGFNLLRFSNNCACWFCPQEFLFTKKRKLVKHSPLCESLPHCCLEEIDPVHYRLFEVVESSLLDEMNRLSSGTVSSDKNYRYLGVEFLYSAEKLKAAHPRHLDIGNNEVYGAPRQYLKGLLGGTKGNNLYVPGGRPRLAGTV